MILHATTLGAGAPVVLMAGLFGQGRNFGALQRHLGMRARAIALDLRNHGESPHADTMSYAEMAADVVETLATLDALPCALLGHSMGGKVAMRAALDRPDAVARLIVADVAPVPYDHDFADFIAAMRAVPLSPGLTRAAADAALAAAGIADGRVRGFLLQNLRLAPEPGWRLGLDAIERAMPQITGWEETPGARYDGPATFLAGGASDYLLATHHAAIRALFPAARFETVDGAGHWLHADQPAALARLVDEALTGWA
jgi:pimeloyl-ACP methyl ester carboxylesterase